MKLYYGLGGFRPKKRVFDVLEIFSKVAQALPGAKLMIVGRGDTDAELAAVAARVKELAIEDSVVICGYWKDTAEFYKGAAVYISTSANESFSMTLLESKGYGLPCVIYDLPNLELLKDERGVIRVAQKDVIGAANAVIALLKDHGYRSRVGRDARDSAVDFVSAIDLGSAWQNVFNELGAEKIQGMSESPPKNTLRRGLEGIFGFYRVGLERRDARFAAPDSTPLNWKPAKNIGIVPEEIARGMKKLENMAVIKYIMVLSSAMERARKTGPSPYSDMNLTTRRLGHARRAIRILSVYAVAITVICAALFISCDDAGDPRNEPQRRSACFGCATGLASCGWDWVANSPRAAPPSVRLHRPVRPPRERHRGGAFEMFAHAGCGGFRVALEDRLGDGAMLPDRGLAHGWRQRVAYLGHDQRQLQARRQIAELEVIGERHHCVVEGGVLLEIIAWVAGHVGVDRLDRDDETRPPAEIIGFGGEPSGERLHFDPD
jgi:hypothetical protein